MKIERARFWRIVNAKSNVIDVKKIVASVKLGDMIDDPDGVVFECLSDTTKDFVEYMRKANNSGHSKLYKQILRNSEKESTRYNLMLQASLYSEKLEPEKAKMFAEELEWREATKDNTYAWIRSVFAHESVRRMKKRNGGL